MSEKLFETKDHRIVIKWNPGKGREVIPEVKSGEDSLGATIFRRAETKEEVEAVLSAFATHIDDERRAEFDRRNPRGGPGDR